MASFLVSVVVTGPEAEALGLADTITELAFTAVEMAPPNVAAYVGDPVLVVPEED